MKNVTTKSKSWQWQCPGWQKTPYPLDSVWLFLKRVHSGLLISCYFVCEIEKNRVQDSYIYSASSEELKIVRSRMLRIAGANGEVSAMIRTFVNIRGDLKTNSGRVEESRLRVCLRSLGYFALFPLQRECSLKLFRRKSWREGVNPLKGLSNTWTLASFQYFTFNFFSFVLGGRKKRAFEL